eukprot:SAG22_NODE_255_length_13562_cov_6.101463_3_plen_176_part_00
MSEEPLVCAEYAARYIPALQGIVAGSEEGELPFLKTVATAKHFFDCASLHSCSAATVVLHRCVSQCNECMTLTRVDAVCAWRSRADDLEGVPPETRQQISVNVSKRDQVEYFSPPFESAVKRGRTQSVMCSYNAVNGMPACLSDDMINKKMRGEWGFEEFVRSLHTIDSQSSESR